RLVIIFPSMSVSLSVTYTVGICTPSCMGRDAVPMLPSQDKAPPGVGTTRPALGRNGIDLTAVIVGQGLPWRNIPSGDHPDGARDHDGPWEREECTTKHSASQRIIET